NFLQANAVPEWLLAVTAGVVSSVLDNFATAASFFALNPSTDINAPYWAMISYMSAVGGNVLIIGSIAGIALMRTEKIHIGWYFMHVGWKAMVGAAVGFGVLLLIVL
ncbi:MAG: sodium:proton antiporter, partial [Prevotella sp.]|nr:sodium:proton antiporter [Prevotella sp.]